MSNNLNILFVDDTQSNIDTVADEFKKQGFNIEYDYVSSCNDILHKLNTKKYDLIVSEYNFCGVSVFDVLNLLSEIACEVPVIVISDHDDENDMINCIKAGCRDYLVRSSISRLRLTIVRIFDDEKRYRHGEEMQKQLLLQNKYLAMTLESIGEGLIVTDLNGQITLMNETARKLTECSLENKDMMPLEKIFRLSGGDGQNIIRPMFEQVIRTGHPTGLNKDTLLTTLGGKIRYVSAMISPVKAPGSAVTGVVIIFRDITRFRRIEKELEEEKSKLAAIFDATPVGLIILDSDLIVRRVNHSLADLLGISADEMINKKIGNSISCIHSTQNSKGCGYGEACKSCSLTGVISEVNDREKGVYGREIQHSILIEDNKKDLWFRINIVPTIIRGSKHVILVMDDITESKKTEEALVRSRNFYLTLFENFPALIWRSGQDANCDYFNRSWLEFTGHSLEEELGDAWRAGVHPDDWENCYTTYINAFNTRQSFEMEYRLRRFDGEYRWIYDAGRPFYDIEGSFLGYIGSCYDITEKRNELELMSKYQLLSEKTNDIIIFIDTNGNILEVNDAAISAYGYTREEFLKLTLFDLHGSEDVSILKNNLETICDRRELISTIHYRKDRSSFPVESSWSKAECGNTQMILCVIRDITERKKFQESLEKRNKELQDTLERLRETQCQLIQQEKLAAIGHLAAGVAHEINNPLGFVMSNVKTLDKYSNRLKEVIEAYDELKDAIGITDIGESRRKLDEINKLKKTYRIDLVTDDLKALIDDINDGLDRIKKIVMGLRTFSRIDNQDESADYDLNDGIENTLIIANNEIKYYADVERNLGNVPQITLSGGHINQVLLNIVINAVHAIKEKKSGQRGFIRISTYTDKGYVCCDIEDNGIGIPEENLNKIFNPFFTTKQVGQGTGLGLSISYDIIVNKYGGDIIVKSTPGKGTVFTIRLPLQAKQRE